MQRFDELPSELILREIFSNLEPKFFIDVLSQINNQISTMTNDALYWKDKIEKHFFYSDYSGIDQLNQFSPFNKATFKKIEAARYKNFSEPEKELLRLIMERDIESLQQLDISLEMWDKKDSSGTSLFTRAENINYPPLLNWLYQASFAAAKKSFSKKNGELDHKKTNVQGLTILYWAFIFKQHVDILIELMKHGNFAECYFDQFNPFHLAIELGRLDFIEALFNDNTFNDIRGSLLEQRNFFGQTPLILAAKNGYVEIVKFLLDKNASYIAVTDNIACVDYGKTAFHWAVKSGNLAMVKLFIERFPELLEKGDILGEVPLIWAASKGQPSIVKYLLDQGANHNVITNRADHEFHCKTVFYWAVQSGNLETVKLFIERFPELLEEQDIFGEAPLIWAASAGHASIVKYLLDNGANPNVRTNRPQHKDHNKSPLYCAVFNKHREVVLVLIKSGAIDSYEYSEDKFRVMHIAAAMGRLDMVKTLMETKPDLRYIAEHNRLINMANNYIIKDLPNLHTQKNAYDQTPLFFAAHYGHVEVVKYFLDRGASPNVKTNRPGHESHGETALLLAYEEEHISTVALLVKSGADAKLAITEQRPIIHRAAKDGQLEMLKALIENDPNPPSLLEQKDGYGQTPLLWAAAKGHTDIVLYLLSKGANPDVASYSGREPDHKDNGKTPLQWAWERKHSKIVAALFKATHGKIVLPKDTTLLQLEVSLLHFAAQNGDLELVKIILEANENKNELLNPQNETGLDLLVHSHFGLDPLLDKNPLLMSVQNNHIDIVNYLLSQGANPDVVIDRPPFDGETPLYWAFENGKVEMVAALVKYGANTRLTGKRSKQSPIDVVTREGNLEMVKVLIENDPQTQSNTNAQIAFRLAAEYGHTHIVKYLLNKADLNKNLIDDYEDIVITALDAATHYSHSSTAAVLVKALIKMGVTAKTLLHPLSHYIQLAVSRCNLDLLKSFLEFAESSEKKIELLNQKNEIGVTPLTFAVSIRDVDIVEYLLSQGANPNLALGPKYNGMTGFQLAFDEALFYTKNKQFDLANPNYIKILKIVATLVKHRVNAKLPGDSHAIHVAVQGASFGLVKILVENDPTYLKEKDIVVSHVCLAAAEGHADIVEYLVSKCINPDMASYSQDDPDLSQNFKTLLHQAFECGNHKIVASLLKGGVNLDASLIHLAIEKGNLKMVKALLENKNKKNFINHKNDVGQTPLLFALAHNRPYIAEYLLHQGADPNQQDKLGRTPLLFALSHNDYDNNHIATYLLKHGADPNVRVNYAGYETTALYIAAAKGKSEIVDLILQKGATLITDDKLINRHNNFPPFHFKPAEQPLASRPSGSVRKKIKFIDHLATKKEESIFKTISQTPITFFLNHKKNVAPPVSQENSIKLKTFSKS